MLSHVQPKVLQSEFDTFPWVYDTFLMASRTRDLYTIHDAISPYLLSKLKSDVREGLRRSSELVLSGVFSEVECKKAVEKASSETIFRHALGLGLLAFAQSDLLTYYDNVFLAVGESILKENRYKSTQTKTFPDDVRQAWSNRFDSIKENEAAVLYTELFYNAQINSILEEQIQFSPDSSTLTMKSESAPTSSTPKRERENEEFESMNTDLNKAKSMDTDLNRAESTLKKMRF